MNNITISANIVASDGIWLVTQLKTLRYYFDTIRVLNTGEEYNNVRKIVKRFGNVRYMSSPFTGVGDAFSMLIQQSPIGEWFLFLSDDELPTTQLLENLYNDITECMKSDANMIYYAIYNMMDVAVVDVDSAICNSIRYLSRGIAEKYSIPVGYVEMYVRMFHNTGEIGIAEKIHNRMTGPCKPYFSIYPILHRKKPFDYIKSCVWQCVCDALTEAYLQERMKLRDMFVMNGVILDRYYICEWLAGKSVPKNVKEWIWEHKDIEHHYLWSPFLLYYLVYHPEELPDGWWDTRILNLFKYYALGGRDRIDVLSANIHDTVKELMLAHGVTELHRNVDL